MEVGSILSLSLSPSISSLFLPPPPFLHFFCVSFLADMGQAQNDGSTQELAPQPPALDTTKLVLGQINDTNLLLHIGDISYARGFAGVVSAIRFLHASR